MPSFEIPDGPATVALTDQTVKGKPVRAGTATFSVTNKTSQPLACHLDVQPQGDAKAEWFEIMGEAQRNFAVSETQKIAVNIQVPQTATPGDYRFRFRAVNVNDPDNDYTESPVATFAVVAASDRGKKPFPWWIVIVGAVVLLLIVGGVVAWLLIPGGKVTVPDVSTKGLTYDAAAQQITDAGLAPQQSPTQATTGTPGTVVDQDPKPDAQVDKSTTVTLTVAASAPTIEVPDVSSQGYSFDEAKGFLSAKGFTATRHEVAAQGKPPDTVLAQTPAGHAMVPESTKDVTLDVDPGVKVPDISSGRNLTFQQAYNTLHGVGLNIGRQNCRYDPAHAGNVVGQNPAAGAFLAKGKDVAVDMASAALCIHFIPFVLHEVHPIHP